MRESDVFIGERKHDLSLNWIYNQSLASKEGQAKLEIQGFKMIKSG
jgi:hypothetical protein